MVAKNELEKAGSANAAAESARPAFAPETDIYETEEAIYMAMNVPGVDEKSIDISLDGDTLSIEAPQAEEEAKGLEQVCRGYRTGVYKRSFSVLVDVDKDQIKAKASNGVLRLTLPKSKKEEPKRIEIAVG